MFRFVLRPRVRAALTAPLLALAAACGSDDTAKPQTQVAARVNDDEITVHQINSVLAKTPNVRSEAAERVKREILQRLIDQQLAKQQALQRKLDRSPAVQQALEAARSEILARAYYEQIATAQPRPGAEETKKYYAEHPELFAQRRVFLLEELVLAANDSDGTELRQRASAARSLKEVADWLSSRGVKFVGNRGVRASEQLPMEWVSHLHKARDGDTLVLESAASRSVVRVVAAKSEPVDQATATPRIEQYLANRRTSEAVAQEMKQLKAGARIEYMGEFSAPLSEAKAKAEAKADAQAKAQAQAEVQAQARAQAEAATKARLEAETKARREAEARARAEPGNPGPLQSDSIKRGLR
jgi:EpsD family peptidyl-prolyl cis-trans isomerase